jgi:selenocysteine lyase/cysteine desulfurase
MSKQGTPKAAEAILEAAVEAAREAAADRLHVDDLVVVVNVAWRTEGGNQFAYGSAVPPHGVDLLADSLRQSAEEAEEAQTGTDHE